uniref:beta-ketoacyl synthase N-terminal-like domain-containing protein n=1 Tax=Pseudolysinimonas sp. TaxID=2680009 RepID=UPI00286BE4E4
MTKRIVVTGIGASTPLGGTAQDTWTALLAGESGANTLSYEWASMYDLPVTFAMEAKVRPAEVLERVETKRLDPSAQFAVISAREAWQDAGAPDIDKTRIGVEYSTGIGGLWTLLDAWDTLREKGSRRVLPMTVPMLMPNAASAAVSMDLDARAFARTDVSACASSTEAIANAYD